MTPTIHLNGTSKERLLEAIEEAYAALNTAQDKLKECTPNGRDYYPQDSQTGRANRDALYQDAIYKALDEHRARQKKLEDVKMELQQLAEAIDAQGVRR